MAQIKSYRASANKGKGGQVFINNCVARHQKASKERARNKEREERASELEYKRRMNAERKEIEARKKHLERERIKGEKERIKGEIEQNKLNEKIQKFYKRLIIEFQKKNLILTEDIALEIIESALGGGVTLGSLKTTYIDGEEEKLLQRISASILATMVEDKLLESSFEDYSSQTEYAETLAHLIKKSYSTLEEVTLDDCVAKYCNGVVENEKYLVFRIEENSRIEKFLIDTKIRFLPDDFYTLEKFVEKDDGKTLTVQSIKESSVFKDGATIKENLVIQVNKKFEELIVGGYDYDNNIFPNGWQKR